MKKLKLFELGETRPKTLKERREQMALECEIWRLEGVLRRKYNTDDLDLIIARSQRIGVVPKGYHYPELVRRQNPPIQLQEIHIRKLLFQGNRPPSVTALEDE